MQSNGYSFELSDPFLEIEDASLFNSARFLLRNQDHLLQFVIRKEEKVAGIIHFAIRDRKAVSPWNATYGGLETQEIIPENVVNDFLSFILEDLSRKRFEEVHIKTGPDYLDNESSAFFRKSLNSNGFEEVTETGQMIFVNDAPFEDYIRPYEKRKMTLGRLEKLVAWKGEGVFPREAYEMIVENRKIKKIPATLEYRELEKNFKEFSDKFIWFGVRKNGAIIASSIGVRAREGVLYHFFPGHNAEFDRISPMVLLIAEEFRYCQYQGLPYLDLGKSSIGGILNKGLFQFKSNLGAVEYKMKEYRRFE